MIEAGLIDEVKKLFKHKDLNPLNTVGYKEIFEFIEKSFFRTIHRKNKTKYKKVCQKTNNMVKKQRL